jgi:hypothetical protein
MLLGVMSDAPPALKDSVLGRRTSPGQTSECSEPLIREMVIQRSSDLNPWVRHDRFGANTKLTSDSGKH